MSFLTLTKFSSCTVGVPLPLIHAGIPGDMTRLPVMASPIRFTESEEPAAVTGAEKDPVLVTLNAVMS